MICEGSGTVGFLSVLGNVKTTILFLLGYANSHHCFEDREYDVSKCKGKYTDEQCTLELYHEIKTVGKYGGGNCSPDTAYTVYGDGTDWIVNSQLV